MCCVLFTCTHSQHPPTLPFNSDTDKVMAITTSSSSTAIINTLHRVFHRSPFTPHHPKLLSSFFTSPLFTPTAISPKASIFSKPQLHHTTKPSSLFSSLSSTPSPSLSFQQDHEIESEESVESEDIELEESLESESEVGLQRDSVKLPTLTVKEKKELASYAHALGKKLKCQLVGKSGVTDGVVSSFIETLESNELLKIKIHRTCPGELEDVVQHLEQATGSVVVGQIGRTIIVYRPSLTKLKAEEKKRQDRRMYMRRVPELKADSLARIGKNKTLLQPRGQVPRLSQRGRRGSSRMQSTS